MSKKTSEKKIVTKKSKEYLRYDFLREEKEALSLELAQKIGDISLKESHKKEVVKSLDAEIAAFEASISNLAAKVKDGYEFRDVEIEINFNFDKKEKEFKRLDIKEVYKTLPLTDEELQLDLMEGSDG